MQMSRENDRSQQYWKEPPKETSYEAHLRRKRLKQQQRARSPKSQVPSQDSVEAREVERGREGLYGRPSSGVDAAAQEETIRVIQAERATQSPGLRPIKAPPTTPPHPRPYGSSSTRLPGDYREDAY